ncbi:MAG: OB-fold nucleic acid binding domain-containing protein [Myxococcota bacterium]
MTQKSAVSAPRITVAQLVPGQRVDSVFLVTRAQRAATRAGQAYLNLTLSDATGDVVARVWDGVDAMAPVLVEGALVRVDAQVQTWREETQLVIERAAEVPAGAADLADFLPGTRFPVDRMWQTLRELVDSLEDPWVRRFLAAILDDADIAARMRRAPAGRSVHHAYVGGLLEHVLSVCRVLDLLAGHYARYYPNLLNRSLLIAGGILHDLAKVWELSYDGAFGYTDEGRLVGHLVMGTELVGRVCDTIPDFPADTRLHLRHLVVGHHGKLEYGSPQLPQTPEALVLHYVDDLDSKVNALHTALAAAGDARWTDKVWSLGRSLWNVYEERGVGELPVDLPGGVGPSLAAAASGRVASAAPGPKSAAPAAVASAAPAAPMRAAPAATPEPPSAAEPAPALAAEPAPAAAPAAAPAPAPPPHAPGPEADARESRSLDLFGA